MVDDAELVARAKQGDDSALETLLRRYETAVFSFMRRMLDNRHDAEDATQEAFVKAIRALPAYREQGRFKSWLFQIAYREGLRTVRSRGRLRLVGDIPRDVPAPTPAPDTPLREREEARRIARAVDALPAAERRVVALRVYSGLPFKDIAVIMDCPVNTALGRMHNACKRLRGMLKR